MSETKVGIVVIWLTVALLLGYRFRRDTTHPADYLLHLLWPVLFAYFGAREMWRRDD
jgi:hypothetical protein